MNSLGSYLLYTITVVTAVLHLLLSPASCFSQQQGSDSTRVSRQTLALSPPPSPSLICLTDKNTTGRCAGLVI